MISGRRSARSALFSSGLATPDRARCDGSPRDRATCLAAEAESLQARDAYLHLIPFRESRFCEPVPCQADEWNPTRGRGVSLMRLTFGSRARVRGRTYFRDGKEPVARQFSSVCGERIIIRARNTHANC
jgi:hypothetical protein